MKKDFATANTSRVYDTIAEATAAPETTDAPEVQEQPKKKKYKNRKEYTPEESAAFLETFQTAGRKGLKLPRINLALSPENREYCQRMAHARGESITAFINWCLREHRDQNQELYAEVQEFLKKM